MTGEDKKQLTFWQSTYEYQMTSFFLRVCVCVRETRYVEAKGALIKSQEEVSGGRHHYSSGLPPPLLFSAHKAPLPLDPTSDPTSFLPSSSPFITALLCSLPLPPSKIQSLYQEKKRERKTTPLLLSSFSILSLPLLPLFFSPTNNALLINFRLSIDAKKVC